MLLEGGAVAMVIGDCELDGAIRRFDQVPHSAIIRQAAADSR